MVIPTHANATPYQTSPRVFCNLVWYPCAMSEINVQLWSALADLMNQYDAERSSADNHRKYAEREQDLELLRQWMAVEMDAQKSLHSLAEVIQMLLASEGLVALAQELNPQAKKLTTLKNWMTTDHPTSTEK